MAETKPKLAGKVQATFNIPRDLLDEMRMAALHFSGPPYFMSLASIAETAIRSELDRLVRELNGGKPIPSYGDQSLRPGRPIKSNKRS